MKQELEGLSNNPQGLLLEAIHSAGYSGALANPLMAPESALNRLDGTIMKEFVAVRQRNFVNSAMGVITILFIEIENLHNYWLNVLDLISQLIFLLVYVGAL